MLYRPELVPISAGLSPTHKPNGHNAVLNHANYSHLSTESNSNNGYDTFPPWREKIKGKVTAASENYSTNSPDVTRAHYVTTEAVVHHNDRPKVTVKPRPIAKIVAKTKRGSRGDVSQTEADYYLENVAVSCEDLKTSLPQSPLRKQANNQGGYVNGDVGGGSQYEKSSMYDNCDSKYRPCLPSNNVGTNHKHNQQMNHVSISNCSTMPSNCANNSPKTSSLVQRSHSSSTKEAPVPPKKPPPPQAHIFQLSSHPCLDESFELSPAPSVDEFPPPPYPIMCEEQIRNLRSIKENPPTVDDDCLSQCGDHVYAVAPAPAAYSDDRHSCCLTTPTGTIVRRRPLNHDGLAKQNRNDSTASMDSNSSTETLPFANENVGTIKQKNGVGNSSAPASQTATPRRHVSDVFNGVGDVAAQKQLAPNNQTNAK